MGTAAVRALLSIALSFVAISAAFAQNEDTTQPNPGYQPSADDQGEIIRAQQTKQVQDAAAAQQQQLEAEARAEIQREQAQKDQLALIQAQADAQANAQIKVDQARAQTQSDAEYQRSVARAMAEYPESANADSALGRAISNRFANMPSSDPLWQNPDRAEVVARQEADKLGIRGVSEDSTVGSAAPGIQKQGPHVEVGTAFFVTTNGYLLTDFHVVKDANNIQIKDSTGLRPAEVVACDPINDIAVLKVAGPSKCLPIGDSGSVSLGEDVFTVGFPNPDVQGLSPKLTRGQISSLAGLQDDPRMYQISAPVQPGNSGGCLVDSNGNVVGIISSQLDAVAMASSTGTVPQNVNYALKIAYAKLLLSGLSDASGSMGTPKNNSLPFDQSAVAAQNSTVMVIAQ